MIPRRLIRTVPTETSDEVEGFWAAAIDLHPEWDHVTLRDPLDPSQFPRTSPHWPRCSSGAQLAGLVRLEAVWTHGGVYIDSDVECYRPMDDLLVLGCFAGWEDDQTVPDAVFGATAGHPALDACLELAIGRLYSDSADWRDGAGAWSTGPGVFTAVLPNRDDVTLFGPDAFYPYHYTERDRRHEDHRSRVPTAYAAHHWHGSWL